MRLGKFQGEVVAVFDEWRAEFESIEDPATTFQVRELAHRWAAVLGTSVSTRRLGDVVLLQAGS